MSSSSRKKKDYNSLSRRKNLRRIQALTGADLQLISTQNNQVQVQTFNLPVQENHTFNYNNDNNNNNHPIENLIDPPIDLFFDNNFLDEDTNDPLIDPPIDPFLDNDFLDEDSDVDDLIDNPLNQGIQNLPENLNREGDKFIFHEALREWASTKIFLTYQ